MVTVTYNLIGLCYAMKSTIIVNVIRVCFFYNVNFEKHIQFINFHHQANIDHFLTTVVNSFVFPFVNSAPLCILSLLLFFLFFSSSSFPPTSFKLHAGHG